MNSIWNKIKLAFGKKPQGDILLPPKDLNVSTTVKVEVPALLKPKRTRKKKESNND